VLKKWASGDVRETCGAGKEFCSFFSGVCYAVLFLKIFSPYKKKGWNG